MDQHFIGALFKVRHRLLSMLSIANGAPNGDHGLGSVQRLFDAALLLGSLAAAC